ncbi:MAG TPA: F0F1 ATP synthase assembly protein I [Caulobacter sp.]|nr:F0F1 ATP synthase assembly protein I [Caulobacter sp.]
MPRADENREEALRRLDERAAALQARTARAKASTAGEAAAGQAWRIIAELLGGVLVGLAFGAIVDWFLPTRPWGMIGGVIGGFLVSLWMAKRTADRLMAQAKAEQGEAPLPSIVDDEDED